MYKITNFNGGKTVKANTDNCLPVFDPSIGEQIGEVVNTDKKEFDSIVKSSVVSQREWALFTPLKRSRILSKYKSILEKNVDALAKIISTEHGKTIEDAKGSLTRGIEVVEFSCGIPHLLKGEFSNNVGTNIDSWTLKQPLGVCAGITPFNFPAMVPMWMFPVAIACGNSFILKPSEKNPSCAIKLAEFFSEAGLPDNVFNVVNGNKQVVDYILDDQHISSVSFVGSTDVAKYIYRRSAENGKRVQALGGAKNHLVVMPDANIEQAVDGIIGAAYGSAGERCMAISVAVAVGNVADELVNRIDDKAKKLNVLPWTNSESDMGPVISLEHKSKIEDYISQGIEEGANLVLDGRINSIQGYEKGYFLGPSIFDNVTTDMTIYNEEIFGPVLSIIRANNYEEAIEIVNNHRYGNGASIYTSNGEVARHFTTNTKIGMVGVNVPIPVPMAFHSFGGWKESLFGSNGMHGMEGINFYTKLKTITSRWPGSIKSGPEFQMPTN